MTIPVNGLIIIEWPAESEDGHRIRIFDAETNDMIHGVLGLTLQAHGTWHANVATLIQLVDAEGNPVEHAIAGPGGPPLTDKFTYLVTGYRIAPAPPTEPQEGP